MGKIKYSYTKKENAVEGVFYVKEAPAFGIYIDIKLKGDIGSDTPIEFRCSCVDGIVYENKIKSSKEMGQYIELLSTGEYSFFISEPVDVVSITQRERYIDFGNVLEYKTTKTVRNYYESLFHAEKQKTSITWFVTWLCNYKCSYCWERVDESKYRRQLRKNNDVDPKKWASGLNALNPLDIYFTGGEPTLYSKLPEVMDYINENIKFKMTTNFSESFDLAKYEKHIKANRFSVLGVSLHPSEVSIDRFLNKISDALDMGINDNCDFGIEMVLYPDDLKYAEKLIKYAESNKVKLMLDNYNDPRGKYKPSDSEKEELKIIKERAQRHNNKLSQKRSGFFGTLGDAMEANELVICGAGEKGVGIYRKIENEGYADKVCCFSDEKKCGGSYFEKDILSHEEAVRSYPDALYAISISSIDVAIEVIVTLVGLGIQSNQIIIIREKHEVVVNHFNRTSEPIWCPAGMNVIHIDPDGDAYSCMRAIAGKKIFGDNAMPHYHALGNVLDGTVRKGVEPIPCWEAHRCSRCDWELIESAMRKMELNDGCYLPLP